MANQALLDAVNKAIEALKDVRRELEREDMAPQQQAVDPQPEAALEEIKDSSTNSIFMTFAFTSVSSAVAAFFTSLQNGPCPSGHFTNGHNCIHIFTSYKITPARGLVLEISLYLRRCQEQKRKQRRGAGTGR